MGNEAGLRDTDTEVAMTREELARRMAEIKQARDERVEIWIQVVEADGTLAEKIYRGSFQRPRKSGD
jgi:hypothetical protein